MGFLLLAFQCAFRNRLRTLISALGVSVTLLALLLLRTLVAAWYSVNEEATATDRMIILPPEQLELFANSETPTKTESELAVHRSCPGRSRRATGRPQRSGEHF